VRAPASREREGSWPRLRHAPLGRAGGVSHGAHDASAIAEYYDRLSAIRRRGDWEGWLRFFLQGVAETATEATATAQAILDLRERDRELAHERGGLNGGKLLDLLFDRPLVNVNLVKDSLGVAYVTANNLVAQFEEAGVLTEITGGKRRRVFRYDGYLALLSDEPRASTFETSQ
jgi:Fic family protein